MHNFTSFSFPDKAILAQNFVITTTYFQNIDKLPYNNKYIASYSSIDSNVIFFMCLLSPEVKNLLSEYQVKVIKIQYLCRKIIFTIYLYQYFSVLIWKSNAIN